MIGKLVKLVPLIIGCALAYIGYKNINSAPAEHFGWITLVFGGLLILSSLRSSKNKTRYSIESDLDSTGGDGGSCGGGE
ncbi:hypothetical protein [Pseudoalteromonas luteoviolacea]|uniref:Uncharacterized protein n=1 Tax=Pseudoalteromonas luteoviolacea (strain 2ta16) TaxID=1353533 RepID=V4HKY1_PSEL2|nr:hypothetical protein [Pseudoalteromonas luteoviolacea]ESP91475.1 hypothetical protein PL2TA16_00274 [Pseudoalteromonas luteoviolacea 2ta16]KZN40124.1 hypothetical protein N483_18215 [Pseudoalteromonas luteoviolacea NCIMB 1944]